MADSLRTFYPSVEYHKTVKVRTIGCSDLPAVAWSDKFQVTESVEDSERTRDPYDWINQSSVFKDTLEALHGADTSAKGDLLERFGYSLFRSSMQSDNSGEFGQRIRRGIDAYRNATSVYRNTGMEGEAFRCQAMENCLAHWLSARASERKRLLSEAWRLTTRSLNCFRKTENEIAFGLTYNRLAMTAGLTFVLEWDFRKRAQLLEEVTDFGRRAVEILSRLKSRDELAKAYTITSGFLGFLSYCSGPSQRKELLSESEEWWSRALKTSEKIAFIERATQSRYAMAQSESEILGSEPAINSLEKTLNCVRETRDKILIGSTLDMIAFNIFYRMTTLEDPDECAALEKRWEVTLEESARLQSPFSSELPPLSLLALTPNQPDYYWYLARFEIDRSKKLRRLHTALEDVNQLITTTKRAAISESIANAEHVASKILSSLAVLEENRQRKLSFLQQALLHRRRSAAVSKLTIGPTDTWNIGVQDAYLADIHLERSTLFKSPRDRERVLLKAISLKERSLRLCGEDSYVLDWGGAGPSPYYGALAKYQLECGDMYRRLYDIRHRSDDLGRASQKYFAAADSFRKVDQVARMGAAYLKAAATLEEINDHLRASESYFIAAGKYNLAAQKIPSLKKTYEELSFCMKARSEVEKAKNHHRLGNYTLAGECYRKAASLQQSSGSWSYLWLGFMALSQLEGAEDKSARYLNEEVVLAFTDAARIFHEARISIETNAVESDSTEDIREHDSLTRTFAARESYCLARADFEEARILQMKGEQQAAREKFARAVVVLQDLAQQFQSDPDRDEAKLIIFMAKAWEAMAHAETGAAPEFYEIASQFFDKAGASCPHEKLRLLLMGHSRYCSSLESASRFLDSGRVSDYHVAVQRLESAANYFTASGFHNASEQSRGTKLLLAAYLNLNTANRENNQEKKAQLYLIVEKLLKVSAESFGESGHVAKKSYVTSLVDRVRQDRELALSLSDASLATSFIMPSGIFPTNSRSPQGSAGVERLQGAFVVANVFSSPTNPKLGEPMNLKIELANAGMNTAQLVRVERIVPEGFELVEKPREFQVKQRNLILKSRRLEPSKTEELNLVLKPSVEGALELNPRVLYLDENGQGRIHEPNPVEVVVRDDVAVGDFASSPVPSSGKSLETSPIMRLLTEAFVEDYMRRRLSLEHSGWRGLLDIVRALRIPRSQVYGDARYRHTFGKPLERLVKKGIVEFRVFPGSRGRGGNIVKVRVSYEKEPVKRFVDNRALSILPLAS